MCIRDRLLCCGAGAALAAIFKAPITGVVFVLEILLLALTSRTVVPLLILSLIHIYFDDTELIAAQARHSQQQR